MDDKTITKEVHSGGKIEAIGTVKTVIGTVKAVDESGAERVLVAGDKVYANETIATSADGVVLIEFKDGTTLDLPHTAHVVLDTDVFNPAAATPEKGTELTAEQIQEMIARGEDPTAVTEATAAGGAQGDEGSSVPIDIAFLNSQGNVTSGYPTIGIAPPTFTTTELLPPVFETEAAPLPPTITLTETPHDEENVPGDTVHVATLNVMEDQFIKVNPDPDLDLNVHAVAVPDSHLTQIVLSGFAPGVLDLVETQNLPGTVVVDLAANTLTISGLSGTSYDGVLILHTIPDSDVDLGNITAVATAASDANPALTVDSAPESVLITVDAVLDEAVQFGGQEQQGGDFSISEFVDSPNVHAQSSDPQLLSLNLQSHVFSPYGQHDGGDHDGSESGVVTITLNDMPEGAVLGTYNEGEFNPFSNPLDAGSSTLTFHFDNADDATNFLNHLTVQVPGGFIGSVGGDVSVTFTDTPTGGTDVETDLDNNTWTSSTDFTSDTVNGAPEVGTAAVTVSEEGLNGGIVDSTGNPTDATDSAVANSTVDSNTAGNAVTTGAIFINDPENDSVTVTLTAPTESITSGGATVTWSGDGTNHLVGSIPDGDGTTAVIDVTIGNDGNYVVTLLAPIDHELGNGENLFNFNVGVSVSDGINAPAASSIAVTVEDDAPSLQTITDSATVGSNPGTNLLITLDVSGSMGDPSGISGLTRLEAAQQAIDSLIDQYGANGPVAVQVIFFSDGASVAGGTGDGHWLTAAEAKAAVDAASAGGTTNYDAAISSLQDAFNEAGALAGAQNVSYFLSDGAPNPVSAGIDSTEQTALETFLNANSIQSYAFGLGTGASADALQPIAYDGIDHNDSIPAVVVTDLSTLETTLSGTVVGVPATGNLVTDVTSGGTGIGFGADGPGAQPVVSVVGTGDTADTGYSVDNSVADQTTIHTAAGGTLVIHLDTGSYTYTPPSSANGDFTEHFTYTVQDADGDQASAAFNINVTAATESVNNPPDAVNDAATVDEGGTVTILASTASSVLANDTDPENDTLTVTGNTDPAHGTLTLNSDGTFSYTHDGSETTSDSFQYTISDGHGGSDTATVNITINPVNDAPDAVNDAATVNEGGTVTILASTASSVLANDTDPENDTLTVTGNTDPAHGTLTLNSDGTFSYTHDGSETTSDSFQYTISDGHGGSDTATVNITINPVNDAPDAVNDAATVNEGGTVTVLASTASSVLANDTDPENDTLTVTGNTDPAHGTLTLNTDGTFSYTHDGSATTSDSFQYTISDGHGGSDTATVNITINPVNHAPDAVDNSYTVTENTSFTSGNVITDNTGAGVDSDSDGDTLTVIGHTDPSNGTLTQNSDGTFSYTPNADYVGSDSYTYTIDDGHGGTDTANVNITVTQDPPVLIVGSSVDDDGGASDTATFTTGGGPGEIDGKGGDDVLVGDPGGSTLQAGSTANIALVLDISGSMSSNITFGSTQESRLAALKDAVNNTLDQLYNSGAANVRVHLDSFSTTATSVGTFNLTTGGVDDPAALAAAHAAVNALTLADRTNYEAGLQSSLNWMNTTEANGGPLAGADVNQLVFVSDGEPNYALGGNATTTAVSVSAADAISSILGTLTAHGSGNSAVAGDNVSEVQAIIDHGFKIDAVGISVGDPSTALTLLGQVEGSTGDGATNVTSAAQMDTVIGTLTGSQVLVNAAGNDVINGGGGNDLIFGDVMNTDALAAANSLSTPPGAGYLVFQQLGWTEAQIVSYIQTHQAELAAESGRPGGNDTISGGSGNDTIYGQEGNDIITGGSGDNVLSGGTGADTFVWNSGNTGHDTVTDFTVAQNDVLNVADLLTGGVTMTAVENAGHLQLQFHDGSNALVQTIDLTNQAVADNTAAVALMNSLLTSNHIVD